MSRIGKKPITILTEAKVEIKPGEITVSGKEGNLTLTIPTGLKLDLKDNQILVSRLNEEEQTRMSHGTFRQLISNALKGTTEGWRKELEVKGTGFRVNLEGDSLVLNLGFSHPVKVSPFPGIKFECKENRFSVIGSDKAQVGIQSDRIKKISPPDAYKGKGIRYVDEKITLKPGKSAKAGAGAGAAAPPAK